MKHVTRLSHAIGHLKMLTPAPRSFCSCRIHRDRARKLLSVRYAYQMVIYNWKLFKRQWFGGVVVIASAPNAVGLEFKPQKTHFFHFLYIEFCVASNYSNAYFNYILEGTQPSAFTHIPRKICMRITVFTFKPRNRLYVLGVPLPCRDL